MRWVSRSPGLLVVLVLTGLACMPSLDCAFAYDDVKVVQARSLEGTSNPMVAELRPWTQYFATEYWTGAGETELRSNPLYRPVTVLSFAWTHAVMPGDGSVASEAWPHHLVNLWLHLLNVALVFLLARRVWPDGDSAGPVVAAAVFGLAGIHAEAVAGLVGRAELLAFAGGATAVLLERLGFVRGSGPVRALSYFGASFALFAAMGAKESGVAWWPFLICFAVVEGVRRGGVSWRAAVVPFVLGVVPFALWFGLRAAAFADLAEPLPVAFVVNPLRDLSFGARILEALMVWGFGIFQMIVPSHLSSDYGASVFGFVPPQENWGAGLGYLLLWIIWTVASFLAWRHRRLDAWLGLVAVLGFGFVTSNTLVLVGTIWAERLQYLPSLGIAWLAATAAVVMASGNATWSGVPRSRIFGVVLGLWLLGNGMALADRCRDWKDDPTLIAADVASTPDSLMLRLQAAVQALRRGDGAAWEEHLKAARAVEPRWGRPAIELAAGMMQRAVGTKADAAIRAAAFGASRALLQEAEQATILEADERRMAWRNLGQVELRLGDRAAAMRWYQKLILSAPTAQTRHRVLGDLAAAQAKTEWAQVLTEGERAAPDAPAWQLHRGLEATRRQDWETARDALEAALPSMKIWDATVQNAWIVLGELRQQAGETAAARELFGAIANDLRFAPRFRAAASARSR